MLLLAPLVAHAEEAPEERAPLLGAVPAFVALATDVGPADADEPLTLAFALRVRDRDGLAALADDPRAPRLSAAEAAARFGPLPGAADALAAWARASGLGEARVSADGALVSVDTTVGAVEAALRVPLRLYDAGDITIRSHAEPPSLPAALAPAVEAIVGLTDAPLRPLLALREGEAAADAPPYGPHELRAAYEADLLHAGGFDGAGRTIAITTWGSSSQASLDEYNAAYGLPGATIAHVDADGGAACGAEDVEWDMDVQLAHALAPGAALRVYCGAAATPPAMLAAISRLVRDDAVDAVSQSWGTCEIFVDADTAAAFETRFLMASAQGIAFFTASGDGGSRECTRWGLNAIATSWPATAPHTTSVGGTRLTLAGGAHAGETAWNTCAPCTGPWSASGGGVSSLYGRPPWQRVATSARVSPDVSAVADPATGVAVRSGGAWWQVGGTSAASPIVAGLWTLAVQRHGRLGNAADELWEVERHGTTLRDVTSGSNGDYQAAAGYDMTTGLGSPRASAVWEALLLPRAPALTATGAAHVELAWTAPHAGGAPILGYRVYGGASPAAKELLATVAERAFVDTASVPGAVRYYEVSALNEHGEGVPSEERAARAYAPPQPPRALSATTASNGAVLLSWSAPANANLAGVSAYRVHRDGELLDVTAGRQYNDDLCTMGATCRYHVTAVGVLGESAPSNADTETGLSPGLATPGRASADPAHGVRLVGRERLVLAMDADDALPRATRDGSLAQQHALLGAGVTPDEGRHGGGYRLAPGATLRTPGLASVTLNEGTYMAWVRLDPGTASAGAVLSKPGLALAIGPDGSVELRVDGERVASEPRAMRDDAWAHVAATWGPGGRRVYVDGVLVASVQASTRDDEAAALVVGGFGGVVDEARAYDAQLPPGLVWSLAQRPYAEFP